MLDKSKLSISGQTVNQIRQSEARAIQKSKKLSLEELQGVAGGFAHSVISSNNSDSAEPPIGLKYYGGRWIPSE